MNVAEYDGAGVTVHMYVGQAASMLQVCNMHSVCFIC